jgi:hypothetical protein
MFRTWPLPRAAVRPRCKGRCERQFPRPANDEILGMGIEIALAKWRGVERVEKLHERAHANRDFVSGIRFASHNELFTSHKSQLYILKRVHSDHYSHSVYCIGPSLVSALGHKPTFLSGSLASQPNVYFRNKAPGFPVALLVRERLLPAVTTSVSTASHFGHANVRKS